MYIFIYKYIYIYINKYIHINCYGAIKTFIGAIEFLQVWSRSDNTAPIWCPKTDPEKRMRKRRWVDLKRFCRFCIPRPRPAVPPGQYPSNATQLRLNTTTTRWQKQATRSQRLTRQGLPTARSALAQGYARSTATHEGLKIKLAATANHHQQYCLMPRHSTTTTSSLSSGHQARLYHPASRAWAGHD